MYSLLMTNERLIQLEQQQRQIAKAIEPNITYFRPKVFKGHWTKEEDAKIVEMQALYGNKWAEMLPFLPGRSKRSIRNRCSKIKSAKESKAIRAKATASKLFLAPKLITVRDSKHDSYPMTPTLSTQTASKSKVEVLKPPDMLSKTKVDSLCQKITKKAATSESCLASKNTNQRTKNTHHERLNRMNEPNSKASSYVVRGLNRKHLENNAIAINTQKNEAMTTPKNHTEVISHIVRSHSEDLNSPLHSARLVHQSEENILAEKAGDKILYCTNDATSKTTQCEEDKDIQLLFDAESFAFTIEYATSLINEQDDLTLL